MKKILLSVMLLALTGSAQAQITTTMSSTTVKSTTEQPVLISSEARHAFEVSLQASPNLATQTSPPLVSLAWSALPTATSYTVLRSAQVGGPYVATPVRDALNNQARYLPGKPFYFRVIALNSHGAALDTTSAVAVSTQPIDPDPSSGATARHITMTCNAIVPSGFSLTWNKPAGVDDAVVDLMMNQNGRMVAVGSSKQTGTSYSQTGLPAGSYKVTVTVNYTLSDYPAAGQSTSVHVGWQSLGVTLPVTAAGPCQ